MDCDSDSSWEILHPSAKSTPLPLPSCFNQHRPSLLQVSSASIGDPPQRTPAVPPRDGRPLPSCFQSDAVAVRPHSLECAWTNQTGIPLPDLGVSIPASLQVAESSTEVSHDGGLPTNVSSIPL